MKKSAIPKELLLIPGVGKVIAEDLLSIGIRRIHDLKDSNPEKLYEALCKKQRKHIDRCMLYIFRCAVYYASNTRHNPKLLKWWNWQDTVHTRKGHRR